MLDTFYSIITPETFWALKYCLLSQMHFSTFKFEIIGNNLSSEESQLIESFVRPFDRFAFRNLRPSKSSLEDGRNCRRHHEVLSELSQGCDGDFFAIMDSDIVALAPFGAAIQQHASKNDVFSSCQPMRILGQSRKTGFGGQATVSPSGHNLATTYVAVYRTSVIRWAENTYGIGFERYLDPMTIPRRVQADIPKIDLSRKANGKVRRFDTGKLLALLCSVNGYRVTHQEIPGLIHLGGLSHKRKDGKISDLKKGRKQVDASLRRFFYEVFQAVEHDKVIPTFDSSHMKSQGAIRRVEGLIRPIVETIQEMKRTYL